MSVTRNFLNNNRMTDWTNELENVPNQWGFINSLGLFKYKGITQHSFTFDETTKGQVLLVDVPRGERSIYGKQGSRKTHAVAVPHFTYDDAILPEDLQGVRGDGSAEDLQTLANERANVLERAKRNWAITQEYARMQALRGDVYAPNGTVSINWYTEFGITQKVVDFDLDGATPPVGKINAKCEEVIAHMQDNLLSGEMLGATLVVCSPEFFADLIKHDNVIDAYTYYESTNKNSNNPLSERMTFGKDARMRSLEFGGLLFVEYRGSFADKDDNVLPIVPAGDAYAFPLDVQDMYHTVYSPAHRLSKVNTVGQELYIFEDIIKDKRWEYESESSFLNFVRRPNAIVKLTRT